MSKAAPRYLGYKLRLLRRKRGLTMQELADELGTSSAYISMVENGQREPRATFVFAAARFFQVTMEQLMDDERELEP
jgi:transcriptional regulator with XRE-family HTH domain